MRPSFSHKDSAHSSLIERAWRPAPIHRPTVDQNLTDLSTVERVAEVVRYSVLRLEYALSPGGGLRAWLQLNLSVALFLLLPAMFVAPIVTWILKTVLEWSVTVFEIAVYLALAMGTFAIATAILIATHKLWTHYWESDSRRRRRR